MLSEATGICRRVHETAAAVEKAEPRDIQAWSARQRSLRAGEELALEQWAKHSGCWELPGMFALKYRTGGGAEEGEAMVYFDAETNRVVKANDGNMHRTWLEFLVRLALHNWLFTESPCTLLGFTRRDGFFGPTSFAALFAQPFLRGTFATRKEVEQEMSLLGFRRTSNDDYVHEKFGLRCEDLHGENVLIRDIDGKLGVFDPILFTVEPGRTPSTLLGNLLAEITPSD